MQNRRQNLPEISIETVLSISDSPQIVPGKIEIRRKEYWKISGRIKEKENRRRKTLNRLRGPAQ
jgi:hypothetical protein